MSLLGRLKSVLSSAYNKVVAPRAVERPTAPKTTLPSIKPPKVVAPVGIEVVPTRPMQQLQPATTEALKLKQGVVNMARRHPDAGGEEIRKLRAMDADKLHALYTKSPELFDLYFAYPDEYSDMGYELEGDVMVTGSLIEKYETTYNVKL